MAEIHNREDEEAEYIHQELRGVLVDHAAQTSASPCPFSEVACFPPPTPSVP